MHADIGYPAGRLSSGNVDYEVHFDKATTRNLMVKMIFVMPKVCNVQQPNRSDNPSKITVSQQF